MSFFEWAVLTWILFAFLPAPLCVGLGMLKIVIAHRPKSNQAVSDKFPEIEILIPIKGILPDQDKILESLLQQDYPNYQVMFLIESQDDPASLLVDGLCTRFPHSRKVITGTAESCGQKNHNLVAGIRCLNRNTEIIMFCDSSNMANADWLNRITAPIRTGAVEAVTTFRAFDPRPETIWGVSQAIYAAFLLLLIVNKPKPWGGATAIARDTFNRLGVIEEWSRNVIDDLTLGNILDRAGIKILMDPRCVLRSPLPSQTLRGFVHYMDRQILFPKWTNPIIWAMTVVFYLDLALAILVTTIIVVMFLFGLVGPFLGWLSCVFLVLVFSVVMLLRQVNPFHIPVRSWLASFLPFIFVTGFVFLRSVFRNYIDWHGTKYWPGKGGVVLSAESADPVLGAGHAD